MSTKERGPGCSDMVPEFMEACPPYRREAAMPADALEAWHVLRGKMGVRMKRAGDNIGLFWSGTNWSEQVATMKWRIGHGYGIVTIPGFVDSRVSRDEYDRAMSEIYAQESKAKASEHDRLVRIVKEILDPPTR